MYDVVTQNRSPGKMLSSFPSHSILCSSRLCFEWTIVHVSRMNKKGDLSMSILKRGLKGAPVKRLQKKLGVADDGDFGPGTERALKEWQATNGLAADGIAGPDTFAAIGLPELILLRKGSRGEQVKRMQQGLGIDADGIFGSGTEAKVKQFQASFGLAEDGMAGPATLAKLNTFAAIITDKVIQQAAVQPDEEHFEAAPLPEIKGVEVVQTAEAAQAEPPKSAWGRVKGWFG